MKTAIVGDVHGRGKKLKHCLAEAGVIEDDDTYTRIPGWHTIQLGDLVSLGYGEIERPFLDSITGLFDTKLVGNHELPAIHPSPWTIQFMGWDKRDKAAVDWVRGQWEAVTYQASASVGKWLITHAGLHPGYYDMWHPDEEYDNGFDVKLLSEKINQQFVERIEDETLLNGSFDGIGHERGGPDMYGSIFWGDLDYLKQSYEYGKHRGLPQIVGHTPRYKPQEHIKDLLWCIDTPRVNGDWGGVACITTDDDGANWELTYVP